MSRLIILFFVITAVTSIPLRAQAVFFDFEEWQENVLYDEPQNFLTLNFLSFFAALRPNVTQVPGVRGNAVRIENLQSLFDSTVIPGMLANFDIANFPHGGQAFPIVPDSLSGYIRFNLQPGDTGIIALVFKRAGVPVSVNIFPLFGAIDTFFFFQAPLQPSFIPPDSVLFLIAPSNLSDIAHDGSFIEIDEFKFVNSRQQQLANSSFELFETISFEEPEQWATPNLFSVISRRRPVVSKSTESFEENYSMRVENVQVNNYTLGMHDVFHGAFVGESGFGIPQPLPFSATGELSLSCHYKYRANHQDTGWLVLRPFYFDRATSERVFHEIVAIPLTESPNFIRAERKYKIPAGLRVDSVYFEVYAGNYFEGMDTLIEGNPKPGSTLWIDAISLSETVDVDNFSEELQLYPNPATDYLTLRVPEGKANIQYRIYNQQAQLMQVNSVKNASEIRFTITPLKAGTYLLEQRDGNSSRWFPFIKK